MKRYLLFVGDVYYPNGGMDDFCGGFDSLDDAKKYINPAIDYIRAMEKWWTGKPKPKPILGRKPKVFKRTKGDTWAHIYDTEAMKFVFKTR